MSTEFEQISVTCESIMFSLMIFKQGEKLIKSPIMSDLNIIILIT